MKKEQFRTIVKEIIKEVIEEMYTTTEEETVVQERETPVTTGKQHSQYPKSDPSGTEDGQTSDQKIASRNAAAKSWGDKKAALAAIKNEPEFKQKLSQLRMKTGDEPLPHKTTTNRSIK